MSSKKANPPAYKRRWGDRKDGRLLRSIEPIAIFSLYIMNTRNDANNSIADSIELSARNNIEVSLMVKKKLELNAPETMFKFFFKPEYTINDVYKDMHEKIYAYQNEPDSDVSDDLDSFLRAIVRLPRWILRLVMKLLYKLDYHGLIPLSLLALSPFHGSMVLSSMGSLGVPPVFHHLFNFGNVPMFITFSTNRHENELKSDGTIKKKHYLDFNITMDDRICDGQYYSTALHDLKKYIKNPELLEVAPEEVINDIP